MSRAVVVALAVLLCAACFGSADESFKCNVNGGRCRPLRNHVHVAKMAQDTTEGETAYAEAEEAYDEMQAGIADVTKEVSDAATAVAGAQVTMNAILQFDNTTTNIAKKYFDAIVEVDGSNTAVSTARNQLSNAVSRSNDATFASNSGVSKAQEAETKLDEAKNEAVDAQKKVKADAAKKAVASAVTFFERALRQADLALTAVEKVNESAMYAESASYRAAVFGFAQRASFFESSIINSKVMAERFLKKAGDFIASAEQKIANLPEDQHESAMEEMKTSKNAYQQAEEGVESLVQTSSLVALDIVKANEIKTEAQAAGYQNPNTIKAKIEAVRLIGNKVGQHVKGAEDTAAAVRRSTDTVIAFIPSFGTPSPDKESNVSSDTNGKPDQQSEKGNEESKLNENNVDSAAGWDVMSTIALLSVMIFMTFVS